MATPCERLTNYLRQSPAVSVPMTFLELERLQGKSLPPSARKYAAWWSNTRPHARCWTTAGYKVAHVSLTEETFTFVRGGQGVSASLPVRRGRQRWPAAQLLADLDREFEESIAGLTERHPFTGPSVHFYERTVRMVREAASLRDLANSEKFSDYVYATLTAWGMHRMGERVATKLTEFPIFQATLRSFLNEVDDLRGTSVCRLTKQETETLTQRLAKLIEKPGITAGHAPLVANAKTLHFILPDLVPPIDRTYTSRFFYGRMQPPGSAAEVFTHVFTSLAPLAKRHEAAIRKAIGTYICLGHAKALDNAIVGFVLTHAEHFGGGSSQDPTSP
jgi:hypothetical protein